MNVEFTKDRYKNTYMGRQRRLRMLRKMPCEGSRKESYSVQIRERVCIDEPAEFLVKDVDRQKWRIYLIKSM